MSNHKKESQRDYDSFINDPNLLHTRREAAILRATLSQFFLSLEEVNKGVHEDFLDTFRLHTENGSSAEHAISDCLDHHYPSRVLSHKDAKTISDLCRSISTVLKAEKELTEGAVLTVKADIRDIVYVIRNGVMPPLPLSMRKVVIASVTEVVRERFNGTGIDLSVGTPSHTELPESFPSSYSVAEEEDMEDMDDTGDIEDFSSLPVLRV